MKRTKLLIFTLSLCIAGCGFAQERIIRNFDAGWQFSRGDFRGAEQAGFNDSSWRTLDVPHDWSVESPVDRSNASGGAGGSAETGIGWYRKSFDISPNEKDKMLFIEFDGVMANSDVYINGKHLGNRPYGYSSFRYDITPYLNRGKSEKNVIAVRVDNEKQPASRWYTGAGIYRHVRLVASDPVHIGHWGVFITTPEVSKSSATVKVFTTVINNSDKTAKFKLQTALVNDKNGKAGDISTDMSLAAGESREVEQVITVKNPELWDLETPNLYKAESKLLSGKKVIDDVVNTFGIRSARFDAATGFWLNDKNIKIYGVCLHQDGAAVGVAVPLSLWEERLNRLRSLGVNGIRTAHNPMDPGFYDLCDRMGFVVMDESFDCWTIGKNPYDYHVYFEEWWERDTRDLVMRDRNHPSVVIYSVGNEIRDPQNSMDAIGTKWYRAQQDLIHKIDPTRPVTMALFRPNVQGVYDNGFAEIMDVVGQNYRENELVAAHLQNPNRKVIGTENGHGLAPWLALRDNPFMAGQFLWSGLDYFGEAVWPNIFASYGLLFRSGELKARAYQRMSWWTDKPMVAVARAENHGNSITHVMNWSPRTLGSDPTEVHVYTNCKEVELFLNGKSLGIKPKNDDDSPIIWNFPYEKGFVKAEGRNNGNVVATFELHTCGTPEKLDVTTDRTTLRNNFEDVTHVRVNIMDKNNLICPNDSLMINFGVEGPGKIIAVYNDDVSSHKPFQGGSTQYPAFFGKAYAIVRATADTGTIKVTATADGVKMGSVNINITK